MQRNRWRWKCGNLKKCNSVEGEATSRAKAEEEAANAHAAIGYHGTVTTITSPTGIVYTYRPHGRASGKMVWDRD